MNEVLGCMHVKHVTFTPWGVALAYNVCILFSHYNTPLIN